MQLVSMIHVKTDDTSAQHIGVVMGSFAVETIHRLIWALSFNVNTGGKCSRKYIWWGHSLVPCQSFVRLLPVPNCEQILFTIPYHRLKCSNMVHCRVNLQVFNEDENTWLKKKKLPSVLRLCLGMSTNRNSRWLGNDCGFAGAIVRSVSLNDCDCCIHIVWLSTAAEGIWNNGMGEEKGARGWGWGVYHFTGTVLKLQRIPYT